MTKTTSEIERLKLFYQDLSNRELAEIPASCFLVKKIEDKINEIIEHLTKDL